MVRPSPLVVVLAIAYLAVVAWITLAPVPWDTAPNEVPGGVLNWRSWFERGTWVNGSRFEFAANIAMFVPVGFFLRMLTPRASAWPALIGAAAITLGIEIAQIPLDRVSDPRDLVANGAGAIIGVLVGSIGVAIRRRAARRSLASPVIERSRDPQPR